MHLHSRNLRYLDEVTRTGSMRKAAVALHVTSSAINRQILLLEEQLGTPIYERHPKGLRLTAAGEVLILHVRRTLQDLERAQSEIEDLRGLRRGRVHVAVIEGAAVELLPAVLADFSQTHPRISFTITVAPSAVVPELVGTGEAHIGLSFNSPVIRGVRRVASATMEIGAIMRPDHPLAAQKALKLADCARHKICLAKSEVSVTAILNEAMAEQQVDVDPYMVCNSVETLKAMVRDGMGLTFKSPLGVEREIARGELVFRPLVQSLKEQLLLVEQVGRRLPVAASKLQEYLKASIAATEIRLRKL